MIVEWSIFIMVLLDILIIIFVVVYIKYLKSQRWMEKQINKMKDELLELRRCEE